MPATETRQETLTTAERVAARFDNNGARYVNDRDERLELVAEAHGGRSHVDFAHAELTRYLFEDGSAIVTSGGGWDIEGAEPFSWRGCP